MDLLKYRKKHIPDGSNLFVSFSGGRTSAFMAYFIKTSPIFDGVNKLFAFANTGEELPETIEFVRKCNEIWNLNLVYIEADIKEGKGNGTEYKEVAADALDMSGRIFGEMVEKYGLPNKHFPHCTRELKSTPLQKLAKNRFGLNNYYTAIGIRADEKNRVKRKSPRGEGFVYPLVDIFPIDEKFIRSWWDMQDFDLRLKDYQGNCKFCWKKSLRKRLTIASENPEYLENYLRWEKSSEQVFDRDNIPVSEILKEAEKGEFDKVKDKHEERKESPQQCLFGNYYGSGIDLDKDGTCFCN